MLRINKVYGLMAVVAVVIAGCDAVDPPAFRLDMVQMVASETSPQYQQEIADVLGGLFGTPDEPLALSESGLDGAKLAVAAGPAWGGEKGRGHGLYRKHCFHCHGITGDGQGPTARFLNPYPRDYRASTYKFKSTFSAANPTDADLRIILLNGIPGTAMPSFALLPVAEVEALVEYVKYLSIRGQMETALVEYVFDELGEEGGERVPLDPGSDPEQRKVILEMLSEIAGQWSDATQQMIEPDEEAVPANDRTVEEIAASVAQGRELFNSKRASCAKCHSPTTLGNGQPDDQTDDQDFWNKVNKKFHEETERLAKMIERIQSEGGLDDEGRERLREDQQRLALREAVGIRLFPVRNAIPRDLRKGVYRGGRRRQDIFNRVYAGIPGTPMPGTGPAGHGAEGTLSDAEIWNLVDYVLFLPYEPPSQSQRALPANIEMIAN